MPGLPESTTYQSFAGAVQPAIQKAKMAIKNLPKRTADLTRYASSPMQSGLISRIGQRPISPTGLKEGATVAGLGTVTTPYGGSSRFERFHPALDVAAPIGTPIPAFRGGTVTEMRTGQVKGGPDFGNYVVITTPEGDKMRYSHLYGAFVRLGEQVTKGTIIGSVGATGQTYSLTGNTGAHLDLRIKNVYGKYVNPESLM